MMLPKYLARLVTCLVLSVVLFQTYTLLLKEAAKVVSCPRGGGAFIFRGRIRSLSKFRNTPKALISGQKSTLILNKFSSK